MLISYLLPLFGWVSKHMVLRRVQILLPCGASKENVPIETFNISFDSIQNKQQYCLYLHRGKKNVKVNRNVIQLELSFYL